MRIDGGIASGASQVLVLTVRDMKVRLRITILLCKTKVNNVDLVAALSDTHEEVVRLNVTVNEVTRVNIFNSRNLEEY